MLPVRTKGDWKLEAENLGRDGEKGVSVGVGIENLGLGDTRLRFSELWRWVPGLAGGLYWEPLNHIQTVSIWFGF